MKVGDFVKLKSTFDQGTPKGMSGIVMEIGEVIGAELSGLTKVLVDGKLLQFRTSYLQVVV